MTASSPYARTPDTLAGRRVLVTGGAGFLGTHLRQALHTVKADVSVVSRNPAPTGDQTERWLTGDVSDIVGVRSMMEVVRPEVVFHLTTAGSGSPELDQVLPTLQADLVSTVNMLTTATELGCTRVVLAASLEEPIVTPPVPASPYAAAKWAGAGYARMFHALYHTPVVIARLFMTYGPGQRSHKLVPYVIRSLLAGESPKLSSGRRWVDWVYVDDVVGGLLLAAGTPGMEGAEFDLGSGELVTVRDVVERLWRLIGSAAAPLFGALPDRPLEMERRADAAATSARLGWRARTSLDEGLRRTVESYRTQRGS